MADKESILKIDDLDYSDDIDQEGLAEVKGGRLMINQSRLNSILSKSSTGSVDVKLSNTAGKPFEIINKPGGGGVFWGIGGCAGDV